MRDWLRFSIAILATWRVSASVYYGKEFSWLRYKFTAITDESGDPLSWIGRNLACFWCVSFWCAWPIALVAVLWPVTLVPFALSGAAILLSGGGRTIWREATQ